MSKRRARIASQRVEQPATPLGIARDARIRRLDQVIDLFDPAAAVVGSRAERVA
jgi:hypothetical protein